MDRYKKLLKRLKKQHIFLTITLLVVMVISSVQINEFSQTIASAAHQPLREITKENPVEQTFIAQSDGLTQITLFFATYGRDNISKLNLQLIVNDKVCAEEAIDVSTIENNSFYTIKFRPVKNIEGNRVTLKISSDASTGQGVTLWYSTEEGLENETDSLSQNNQFINGKLVMNISYQKMYININFIDLITRVIVLLTILYMILYLFKYKKLIDVNWYIKVVALSIMMTICIIVISEDNINSALKIINETPIIFWMNMLIIHIIVVLVALLEKKYKLGIYIIWTIFIGIAISSYIKLVLKGEPFLPWDIFSIKEGLAISKENSIFEHISWQMLIFSGIPYVYIYKIKINISLKKQMTYIIGGVLTGIIFLNQVIWNPNIIENKLKISNILWNQNNNLTAYKLPLITAMNSEYLSITKPKNYTRNAIEEIYSILGTSVHETTVDNPNIILIMNESWADLRNVKQIDIFDEVMADIDQYKGNSLYGWTLSPVIGGGTSNAEYEVLTGQSVRFLPPGAMAYSMYVDHNTFSITKYLKQKGYLNIAIHPYLRSFWNRDQVYQDFEFDTYYSDEIIDKPITKNGYIADEEVVNKIIDVYESKGDNPLFCFAVTMQNHQPYTDVTAYEKVIDIPSGIFSSEVEEILEVYLTGVEDANNMFIELAEYIEQLEEPTIVIMFGDHYPPLGGEVYEELLGKKWNEITKEELLNFYSTPFIAYSNYNKVGKDLGSLSMFYLLPTIFKESGIEMPLYFQILYKQLGAVRGYTPQFILDEEGNIIDNEPIIMEGHKLLQYNNLKGKNYYYKELLEE